MNERIKYLAIKSGLDFDGYGYPIWGSCEDAKKKFLEKFAELIIKDQQREWVGLTDEEINSWEDMPMFFNMTTALEVVPTVAQFARFVEAKIKEKNNAA